jgi:hypothetical protein
MDADINGLQALCDAKGAELYKAHCEIEQLRRLLAQCLPHINGNIGEWRQFLLPNTNYNEIARQAAAKAVAEGELLLRDIEKVLADVPDAD